MKYQEAAETITALAICSELIPIGCEKCPAFSNFLNTNGQKVRCGKILDFNHIAEAVKTIRETKDPEF